MSADTAQTLLPSNSTKFERDLASVAERAVSLPVSIRDVWNPQTCPADMLPWLAWSLSVDDWDSNWTEQQKRATIAASVEVHRRKGTIGALRRALEALGYEVQIDENTGQAYTFRLAINVGDRGIEDASVYVEAARIANKTKNARSHLLGVDALVTPVGAFYVGALTTTGGDTTVFPDYPRTINRDTICYLAACTLTAHTTEVFPEPRQSLAWPDGTPIAWPDGTLMTI